MSLLSIPSLVNRNIAVSFLTGNAVVFDLKDSFELLRIVTQEKVVLFYTDDFQRSAPIFDVNAVSISTFIMATIREHVMFQSNKLTQNSLSQETKIWHFQLIYIKLTKIIHNFSEKINYPYNVFEN